jgi:hypothetical protein
MPICASAVNCTVTRLQICYESGISLQFIKLQRAESTIPNQYFFGKLRREKIFRAYLMHVDEQALRC